jgi:hypothetical protein
MSNATRAAQFAALADRISQAAVPAELTNCDLCDIRPGYREMNASGVEGVICLECDDTGLTPAADALLRRLHSRLDHELRDEPRERYSNIEPNTGLRRHGEI